MVGDFFKLFANLLIYPQNMNQYNYYDKTRISGNESADIQK